MVITCLVAFGASLNLKEKIFCSLSWMSKASVQVSANQLNLFIFAFVSLPKG